MDDLISRQAAIELIERMKPYHQEADDIAEMIANMPSAQPKPCEDAVSRADAFNAINDYVNTVGVLDGYADTQEVLRIVKRLPSAQLDRDIPKKPNETTDKAYGISHRQAVCPNCDCYLGTVHFICEGDKRKVTYCESCGQAIDWEGWEEDE